jgi:hypothetical protein
MRTRYRVIVVGAVSAVLLGLGVAAANAGPVAPDNGCATCWQQGNP